MPSHLPASSTAPTPVTLHSHSINYIKKGHPWIIKDEFTAKFPRHALFLEAVDARGKFLCTFLHDPHHPKIKGRVWSRQKNISTTSHAYQEQIFSKLQQAVELRLNLSCLIDRENYYLVFGEADHLPGLFIQKLNDIILLQCFATPWEKDLLKSLVSSLQQILSHFFPQQTLHIWLQSRVLSPDKKQAILKPLTNLSTSTCTYQVKEFGVSYKLHLQTSYDVGIYTDMSAIRQQLLPWIAPAKSLLNLYAYTGAFSLLALQQGVHHVTSVDLSRKHLQWLEENVQLNSSLSQIDFHNRHLSLPLSTEEALLKFIKSQQTFDFIVCDPPPTYASGKKFKSTFDVYKELIPQLLSVTNPQGHLVLFLNTHSISMEKFKNMVFSSIKTKTQCRVVQYLRMEQDCPTLKNFPEGDYLKGILLQKLS